MELAAPLREGSSIGAGQTRESAFSMVAPLLWTSLPLKVHQALSLVTFCHQLKTECFWLAF